LLDSIAIDHPAGSYCNWDYDPQEIAEGNDLPRPADECVNPLSWRTDHYCAGLCTFDGSCKYVVFLSLSLCVCVCFGFGGLITDDLRWCCSANLVVSLSEVSSFPGCFNYYAFSDEVYNGRTECEANGGVWNEYDHYGDDIENAPGFNSTVRPCRLASASTARCMRDWRVVLQA
jgi:hypothetical protein